MDSPLERTGFELPVPGRHPASLSVTVTFRLDYFLRREIRRGEMRRSEISLVSRGTDGPNSASSIRESTKTLINPREDQGEPPMGAVVGMGRLRFVHLPHR